MSKEQKLEIEAEMTNPFATIESFLKGWEVGSAGFLAFADLVAEYELENKRRFLSSGRVPATHPEYLDLLAQRAALRETKRVREDTLPNYADYSVQFGMLISDTENLEKRWQLETSFNKDMVTEESVRASVSEGLKSIRRKIRYTPY